MQTYKKSFFLGLSLTLVAACQPASTVPGSTTEPISNPSSGDLSTKSTYEVWLSDQGNTQGIDASSPTGTHGGRVVVYDEKDLSQTPPVNNPIVLDVSTDLFPNAESTTGSQMVRLHGMLPSPNNRYMALNFVGSGHLGIVDADTKKPVCLFRATGTADGRQNHMTFWSPNGNHLIVSNQGGRMLERIDVKYQGASEASSFVYNASAGLDLVGGSDRIKAQPLAIDVNPNDNVSCELQGVTQDNQSENTPAGNPKQEENKRPQNVPICPIPASNNKHVFTTLGGGGMFVVDYTATPMVIVGEYDKSIMSAAGCGGAEYDGYMHLNTGTSGPGVSEFSMYRFPINAFDSAPAFNPANTPAPLATWRDENNGQTLAIGDNRDAHGVAIVKPEGAANAYLHQFDRVQNNVEVFAMKAPWNTFERTMTYDLTSEGACGQTTGAAKANDPAPDLSGPSPDGTRIFVALRGPKPLTVSHAAEGSCPGLGVVEVSADGKQGKLMYALPTEQMNHGKDINISDPHAAIVRKK